ncbi:hypothetical protein LTR37_012508 [Vermiconidia calcicola]|uniref:Uncharacterized protein n=1 Tax=Vermiconidia calcicola TaxID=1690605 RepID=A0ACC3N0K9_9PEZI|nr:hypothetical protein LTR37_012508 [Vermiconidia calcicola]
MDTAFKDTAVDILKIRIRSSKYAHLLSHDGGDIIKTIYEGTPEGSAARALLVHVFAFYGSAIDLAAVFDHAPKDFYYDIAVAMRQVIDAGAKKGFWHSLTKCHYHCHQGEEQCYLSPQ